MALAFPPIFPLACRFDGCRFDPLTVSSTSPAAISTICLANIDWDRVGASAWTQYRIGRAVDLAYEISN